MKFGPHDSAAFAVIQAVRYGTADELLQALAAKPNLNWSDSEGQTALHFAAKDGKTETVRLLLSLGAEPNAKDERGRTPLTHAAEFGHAGAVEVLLAAGAGTNEDETALHMAAANRQREVVTLLLQSKRLDVNYLPRANETPLMEAARADDPAIILLLVEAGANIDAKDMLGNTALHHAAKKDSRNAAKMLMGLGADSTLTNIYAATPDSVARDESHEHMESLVKLRDSLRKDFLAAASLEKSLAERRLHAELDVEISGFKTGAHRIIPIRKSPVRFGRHES